MLSNEAATAAAYWWTPYRTGAFDKTIVSMMFAGKTDYGTWWSPDASDILGIQVIPMGPSQLAYLSALGRDVITPAFDAVLAYNPQVTGRSHLIDWNIMLLSSSTAPAPSPSPRNSSRATSTTATRGPTCTPSSPRARPRTLPCGRAQGSPRRRRCRPPVPPPARHPRRPPRRRPPRSATRTPVSPR